DEPALLDELLGLERPARQRAHHVQAEREQAAALPERTDRRVRHQEASSGSERGAAVLCVSNDPGGGVTPFSRHHSPGGRWVGRALPSLVGSCSGIGGSGGIS